ncbi:hypothetical protein F6455_07645 [Proteobacteria bacterium 005FR1]|nr:hypothetical protein [Proteobacteria bacterium 005FR1]
MRRSSSRAAVLIIMLVGAVSAFAQVSDDPVNVEEDELRGMVINVDEEANTLTIRPVEVGENLNIPVGTNQTFDVDEQTIIRDDVYATQLDGLENIHENDMVRIDFEEAGGRMRARNVTRDQEAADQQVAQLDQPDQLPATASFLPLLALFGAASWGLALLLRLGRGRT